MYRRFARSYALRRAAALSREAYEGSWRGYCLERLTKGTGGGIMEEEGKEESVNIRRRKRGRSGRRARGFYGVLQCSPG